MDTLFVILILANLILLVIGLFNPSTSLFWYKKERTRKVSALFYGITLLASFILFGITTDSTKNNSNEQTVSKEAAEAELEAERLSKETEPTQFEKDSIAEIVKKEQLEEQKEQTITAADLTQNYIDNEVRADENFKNKNFYVEGTVNTISKDIMDDIYVTLDGAEMFRDVQCYFDNKDDASRLEKGMRITFYGRCDGLMMNVLMKNCKLVDNINSKNKK